MGLHINNELRDLISNYTLQKVYPVGAIYMSVNAVNPRDLFGFGTWEQIKGNYFMAYDPDSTMEHKRLNVELGGWYSHTGSTILTANQSGLPGHTHIYSSSRWYWSESAGGGDVIGEQSSTSYMFGRETQYTGGWNAQEGHTHPLQSYYPVPTRTLNVWKRVA